MLPGLFLRSKVNDSPFFKLSFLFTKLPIRNFGPCKSAKIQVGWLYFFSKDLIISTFFRCSSIELWEKLSLKTSAPVIKIFSIISEVFDAGPRVAYILAFLLRFIKNYL